MKETAGVTLALELHGLHVRDLNLAVAMFLQRFLSSVFSRIERAAGG